jgi:D-cysteine desulfhydrase family pyridoxal phosphate-dependent enzyme
VADEGSVIAEIDAPRYGIAIIARASAGFDVPAVFAVGTRFATGGASSDAATWLPGWPRRSDAGCSWSRNAMPAAFDAIQKRPRARLLSGPTPIEHLARLSHLLGVEVFIKRDDLTGLGMGGNKTRQLEFYFGNALAEGADTVLITGAVQSNYVRAAAAAAAKLGLDAVVQLEERVGGMGPTYYKSGNVLLDDLLGARRMSFPEGENEAGADRALHDEAARLRREGRVPYVIPLGLDNPPHGALGYMLAAREIIEQGYSFDCAVVASGSGLTHAGLLCGFRASDVDMPIHGACVRRAQGLQHERIRTVSRKIEALLDCQPIVGNDAIRTWDVALAPGYGRIGPPAREAIALMAQREGLFVDPVYTAKSLATLIHLVRTGEIARGSRVLFVHTGGLPALFAYEEELRTA